MKKTDKNSQKSRRDFLHRGITAGIASLVLPGIADAAEDKSSEKVKLLSPDGSLVEVNGRLLASSRSNGMANEDAISHFIDQKRLNLNPKKINVRNG